MEEIDVNTSLKQHDLFDLFRQQLKKDLEGAGIDAAFTEQLPVAFDELKQVISKTIMPLTRNAGAQLAGLLYRVDISERQLSRYSQSDEVTSFEEYVAELIIKRELQKVILKRTFSK